MGLVEIPVTNPARWGCGPACHPSGHVMARFLLLSGHVLAMPPLRGGFSLLGSPPPTRCLALPHALLAGYASIQTMSSAFVSGGAPTNVCVRLGLPCGLGDFGRWLPASFWLFERVFVPGYQFCPKAEITRTGTLLPLSGGGEGRCRGTLAEGGFWGGGGGGAVGGPFSCECRVWTWARLPAFGSQNRVGSIFAVRHIRGLCWGDEVPRWL